MDKDDANVFDVISPKDWAIEVREALNQCQEFGEDPEKQHMTTDAMMESLLEALGYGEGVALIQKTIRWAA